MTAVQLLLETIDQASDIALEMEREQRINTLIAFQLFLSEHNYISDHLWDFEDLALKFIEHEG